MVTHAITHQSASRARRTPSHAGAVVRFTLEHYLLLPLGAAVAVLWANTRPDSYYTFAHAAAFAVNEIGMALFLALIAQEIWDAVIPGGALHAWRKWMLPVAGAIGGIAGSAGVYYAWINADSYEILRDGVWAATAVDVAFVYFVIRAIFGRHAIVPFLLLLAFVTNVFGFLAAVPRSSLLDAPLESGALLGAALFVAFALRHFNVRSFWPYLLGAGTLSWWALYLGGQHPVLALLPIVPFLPHSPRSAQVLDDAPHGRRDSPSRFEHVWNYAVQIALFLFALVNAGVMFRIYETGTWALLAASLLGRPLGILAAVAVALRLGLHLPARVDWRDLSVAAIAASIGFTMALFFATSVYPVGPVIGELKLGALASATGLLLAIVAARQLRVGRFSRTAS